MPRAKKLAIVPAAAPAKPAALTGPDPDEALTREEWLMAMTDELRPDFERVGAEIPARIRIACGWPSSRGLASPTAKSRTVGQCWPIEFSADSTPELFISPYLAEPLIVAATLTHELVHAALNCEHGHKGPFRKIAKAIGLTGKMTETTAGTELAERLNALCQRIGIYRHAKLDKSMLKKQGTRMLKLECPDCGYTVRTTAKWIQAGMPTCPCGTEMEDLSGEA